MNLQTKLKMLMEKKDITKAQLSRDTNIPYTTINSLVKRGNCEKIKISTMNTLKRYFDVSLDYLLIDEVEDVNFGKQRLPLTQREYEVIIAYRKNPDMQPAVERILGLNLQYGYLLKREGQEKNA